MLFILAFAAATLGQQYFVGTNENYIVGPDTFSNFSNAAVLLLVESDATVTHLTTILREHDAPTARVAKLDLLCAPSAPFCRVSSTGGYGQARQFTEGSRSTISGLLNSSFTAPNSGYLQQLFTLTLDANTAIGSVSDIVRGGRSARTGRSLGAKQVDCLQTGTQGAVQLLWCISCS
jgi:hypothetical protein